MRLDYKHGKYARDNKIIRLFDFYGPILTEIPRKKMKRSQNDLKYLDDYYNTLYENEKFSGFMFLSLEL